MIKALKALFETPDEESRDDRDHRRHLAAAALLLETARADFSQDSDEERAMEALLANTLNLGLAEVRELMIKAGERVDQAISLYEFTREINDHYSAEEKVDLLHCMWRVAFADGRLDKYEEHLIRRVAELTYVPHRDYIAAKMEAQSDL
ncbi:MAG: TerB family tellurite resistance protein [Pseudomonadota bacterium]